MLHRPPQPQPLQPDAENAVQGGTAVTEDVVGEATPEAEPSGSTAMSGAERNRVFDNLTGEDAEGGVPLNPGEAEQAIAAYEADPARWERELSEHPNADEWTSSAAAVASLVRKMRSAGQSEAEPNHIVDGNKMVGADEDAAVAENTATDATNAENAPSTEPQAAPMLTAGTQPTEQAAAETETAQPTTEPKAEENKTNDKTKVELSDEKDENGRPFVKSDNGTTVFGEITEGSGLTPAPIKLSEGFQDANTGKGYGLVHIEANHGAQIRKAGFASVKEFVSYVATNYDPNNIRIGKRRDDGTGTFLIQVTDTHDNTLFVELSKDGSYWNVNSGGIFRKGYSNKKETATKTEPQQPNNAVSDDSSLSANDKTGITNAEPTGKSTVSTDKDRKIVDAKQAIAENPKEWRRVYYAAIMLYKTNPNESHAVMSAIVEDLDDTALSDLVRSTLITLVDLEQNGIKDWRVAATQDVVNILKLHGFAVTKGSKGVSVGDIVVAKGGQAYRMAGTSHGRLDCRDEHDNDYSVSKSSVKYYCHDEREQAVAEQIAEAAKATDTEPTEAQKKAGNYRKGHVRVDGFDISIEQPKGSVRRGTDADGKQWESEMHDTYGYIRGTEGVDGDHIDVFLSDHPDKGGIYVVDQVDPKTGEFDEHKVMYGYASEEEAKAAYLSNYEKGWRGLGAITAVSREDFKKWIGSSHRKTKPFSEYSMVKKADASAEPTLLNAVKTLYEKGKTAASKLFNMKFFDVAKTPDFMKKLGLTGEKFTIRYGVISRHFGKDGSHDLTATEWEQLPDAIQKPFAITKLSDKKDGYRLYTTIKTAKGEYVVVGVDVKNAGKDIEVNAISTVFGRRDNGNLPSNEELLYKDKKITPEQSSLLNRPNFGQYPTEQELSAGKGTTPEAEKQEPSTEKIEADYRAAIDHSGDVEQEWEEKIQDYVFEHYPTQATLSAETTSEQGLREREAMRNDPVLKKMREDAKAAFDKADEARTALFNQLEEVKQAEKRAADAEQGADGLDGFLATLTPMQKGRVRKVLSKRDNYDGHTMAEAEYVEQSIHDGKSIGTYFYGKNFEYGIIHGDSYKPISVTAARYAAFLGATFDEQTKRIAERRKLLADLRKEYTDLVTARRSEGLSSASDEILDDDSESIKRKIDWLKRAARRDVKAARQAEILEQYLNLREQIKAEKPLPDGGKIDDFGEKKHKAGVGSDAPTEAEAALRDAVVDRLREAGLDVITDEAEGQRVLDEVNGKVKMSAKKRRALETASVSQDEKHQQTVISSADGAKVLKNLDSLASDYENSQQTKEKTFLGETAKALGAERHGSASEYATFETKNGRVVTIRLSNHNAKVSNFDNRDESEGISIVVSAKNNNGINNDGNAHIVEYYYNAIKLRRAEGKPLADIVRSIKQALYSGEFTDTTGLAERQEVNADDAARYHVRFFRTADGEAYGFTVGGKIYVDPRIAKADTPLHEYAHLWATALRKGNAGEWKNVVRLMKDTKVWDEVKKRYPELKADDDIAEEVLTHYSGSRGAERLRAEQQRIIEGDGTVLETAAALSALERVKDALRRFWKGVADFLHIHFTTAEEVADRVLHDLLNGVDPRKYVKDAPDDAVKYHIVRDKKELERLDKEKTFRMYGAMQERDGKLYSPMAAVIDGKLTDATEIGAWMKADEHPELVDANGKFMLVKTNGKKGTGEGDVPAAYNPYMHTSTSMMNDQFTGAYARGNIKVVEWEIPEYEKTSGYHADKAKDAVGLVPWHSGSVNSLLPKDRQRQVMLSQYRKAVRVVPDAEVAKSIARQLAGTDLAIPWNTVTPDQVKELAKLGVPITTEASGTQSAAIKAKFLKQMNELKALYPQAKFVNVKMTKDAYAEWGKGSDANGNVALLRKNDHTSEGLEAVNERFNSELDDFKQGTHKGVLSLGMPQGKLLLVGLKANEMFITPKTLKAHLDKHGISVEDLKDLPKELADPMLVYEWGNKAKSLIVITNISLSDGRKITAAIKLERNGKTVEVNELASVHGKAVERFLSDMENAKHGGLESALKYVDKKKTLDWLGLVPPKGTASLTDQRLSSVAKVIENFENPKSPQTRTLEAKQAADEVREIVDAAKADDSYMKAPNGEPSKLDERQWAQVRTKAFKAWFGDWENDPENASKVVDENGEPLVVYHGTPLSRDQITPNRGWHGFEYVKQEAPFHTFKGGEYSGLIFTSVEAGKAWSIAEKRAESIPDDAQGNEQWTTEGYVYDLYLNVKNPFDPKNESAVKEVLLSIGDNIPTLSFFGGKGNNATIENAAKIASSERNSWLVTETPEFLSTVKELGYDGLVGYDEGVKYIAAFSPNQLKDAYDNSGGFSPEQDSILLRKNGGGAVEPSREVRIVEAAAEHGFANYAAAKRWAKENIARTYGNDETGGKGEIRISNKAIEKFLSESAVKNSDSRDAHLSTLRVLPEVIRESVDAEQHPDFKKDDNGKRAPENGANPDVTMHRLYGAMRIGGKLYRVKVTLKENTRTQEPTKAYSYEATKIELLGGQHEDVTKTSSRNPNNSISAAKLLNGVEKSYGNGEKLIGEFAALPEGERRAAVEQEVAAVDAELGTRTVVKDTAELDDGMRSAVERGGGCAYYDPTTGETVVLADKALDAADVRASVVHENIGHKSLDELLGDKSGDFYREAAEHIAAPEELDALRSSLSEMYGQLKIQIYATGWRVGWGNVWRILT